MRITIPILLFIVGMACGTGPAEPEHGEQIARQDPVVASPVPPAAEPDSARVAPQQPVTSIQRATPPSPTLELRCGEEMRVENNVGAITLYVPKKRFVAKEAGLQDRLAGLYLHAEQEAPRSIADDFEHGISRERIHMPDTLPVLLQVFERCGAHTPHTVLHVRVWRNADGSFGTDGW